MGIRMVQMARDGASSLIAEVATPDEVVAPDEAVKLGKLGSLKVKAGALQQSAELATLTSNSSIVSPRPVHIMGELSQSQDSA